MSSISELIGKPLDDFRLVVMTEVYRTNEDGHFTKSEGCFGNEVLAKAYASGLTDPTYTSLRSVIVLTNGKVGYPIIDKEVQLVSSELAREAVLMGALAKLTPEEIQVLGLGS